MHTSDLCTLVSQHLLHRHLYQCDLRSLGILSRASKSTNEVLRIKMAQLKRTELLRRIQYTKCYELLRSLQLPLLNETWKESIFAKTNFHITYNGRIIITESSGTGKRAFQMRVGIRPPGLKEKGVVLLFSKAFPQRRNRILTFQFTTTRELMYVLRLYTLLGSSLWSLRFNEEAIALTHEMLMFLVR